jgi:hypothetical protein
MRSMALARSGFLCKAESDAQKLAEGTASMLYGQVRNCSNAWWLMDDSRHNKTALKRYFLNFETSGKFSGWRIESTDKSISSIGQYSRVLLGHSIAEICSIVAFLNQGKCSNGR